MYICKHFDIRELVPPQVYKDRGDKAWELFDERMLITLDSLRDRFGPAIVNNWHYGGKRKWSGLRTNESPYGSAYSQHRFGRAADVIFSNHSAEAVREAVLVERSEHFPFVHSIELGVSWFHFDVRNCTPVKTFRP